MKRILFFGYLSFSDSMRASSLILELKHLGYECMQIDPRCYALQVGEIVFSQEVKKPGAFGSKELVEPFILFCGMSGEVLDTALTICRGNTRAILTPSNSKMTVYELSEHLAEEKRLIELKRKDRKN